MNIGLLAFQGAYRDHVPHLQGHKTILVTNPGHMENLDALIIPGGESTVMMKFLRETGTGDALCGFARKGKAVMGICAGACVLAGQWTGGGSGLGLLDISVQRNSMGSHSASGWHKVYYRGLPRCSEADELFIRAPRLICGPGSCSVLGLKGEEPVLVRQGNIFAASFHPELRQGHPLYSYFLHASITIA